MLQCFFCGFFLSIFFFSIDLFSMQGNKLSKNLAYLQEVNKKNQQYEDELSVSPFSMPCFKQQSIALHSNDENQNLLIFKQHQQPRITQYLLDGKQIAKAIQIGDEINFESDSSKPYNFSLQIPYQVGSLTINTSGKCVLEKKIDTYSVFLTCKMVNFYGDFFSSNGLIIEADNGENHAQLNCSDFLFKGKTFEFMSKSSLNAYNSLTLLAQRSIINDGVVDCKKESLIKSSLFKNTDTFASHNMRFDGNRVDNQGTLTITDTFHCASKLFDHSGMLDVSNCIMEKGNVFSSTSLSVWNVKEDWKAFVTSLYLQGSFGVKNLCIAAKNFTAESPLHCIAENVALKLEENMTNAGVIKVLGLLDVDSKSIKLKKTSSILVENADLKVNQAIENEGAISVKNHLSAHAHTISNAGKIETKSASIKADRYYYNKILSILSVKNDLTINTPLSLNLLGLTHAQFLTINSAIGLNALGIYVAKNMSTNALVSLNAGLLLPKFSTFTQMCSWQNVWGLGESLFIKYVPMYGTLYAALKNIQGLYHQGKTLYSEFGSVHKQKNVGASDVIALICLTKCILTSIQQTSHLGKQSYHLLSDRCQVDQVDKVQNLTVSEVPSEAVSAAKDIAQQMASTAVSTIISQGPSVNTNSLFDLNYGIATGINNYSSSLYNHNSDSAYVYNTIDTYWGTNTGYLGAYNLNINAINSYSSDHKIWVSNGNIEAYRLFASGSIYALNNIRLKGSIYASVGADITAKYLAIQSDTCDLSGSIKISDGIVEAYRLSVYGPIDALKNIKLEGKWSADIKTAVKAEHIEIKSNGKITNSAHLNASNAYLRARHIDQSGFIDAQQNMIMVGDSTYNFGTIKAPKISILQASPNETGWRARGGHFSNQGSLQATEQLVVDARNVYLTGRSQISAPTSYFKSDGYWKNHGEINGQQLIIDAPKKDTKNSGFLNVSKMIVRANSDDDGWFARRRKFLNQGRIQASELFVDAKNIHLDELSRIDAQNAYLKSSVNWQNNGQLKAKECLIDAKKNGINNGTINTAELLQMKAHNLVFDKTSDIVGKNAYFQTSGDWWNGGKLRAEQLSIDAQKKAINNGSINVSDVSVKSQDIYLEKTSDIVAQNAYLKSSGNCHNDGKIKAEQLGIDAQKKAINNGSIHTDKLLRVEAQNILFQQNSDVKAKDAYYKADQNVSLDGKTDIERGSVDAGGKVTAIGKIGASNQLDIDATDIIVEKTSDVHAHKASFKAKETIANRGQLSACELFAHGKYVENAGNILVDKAHIKADRYFWNQFFGSIEAKEHLTIDALMLFNTLGYINADSLHTNAILDMNLLGMYRGCNISRNSIIGLNAGILVPDFKLKLSAKEIGWMVGSIAWQQYSPRTYMFCSLLLSLVGRDNEKNPGLLHRGKELYKQVQVLWDKKDLCASDVVPAICEAKNLLFSAAQIGSQGYGLAQDTWGYFTTPTVTQTETTLRYHHLFQNNGNPSPLRNLIQQIETDQKIINTNNILPIFSVAASSAVSSFGSQLSNNSLLDINSGIMLGINGNSQSFYHINSGVSCFANNHSLNTISGTNSGFLGAGNLSVNALGSYVSSGKLDAINLSMTANDLEITGNIHASNNALLKASRNAVIDRKIKANQLTITAQKLHLKDGSQINGATNLIDCASIQGEKGNTITSQNGTFMKTNELDNKGTVHGPMILDFNGNADQLKSIGGVEQLGYKGTMANNLADKLADGHNDLLNVAQGGAVNICADKEDVHLKEQHTLDHALTVQTEGAIACDKDLFSEKSLWLQAKDDVQHASVKSKGLTGVVGKNISSEGHKRREYNGENYKENCEESNVSGNQVIIQAQENIHYKGTHVHSGVGGTQAYVGNRLIADDLTTEEYSKTSKNASGRTWETNTITEDKITTSVPCTFSSDGVTQAVVGDTTELHGTNFNSKGGTILNSKFIEDIPTYDTHSHIEKTHEKILLFKDKETETTSTSQERKSVTFEDEISPLITSENPVSLHLECNAPIITINAPEVELLVAKKETEVMRKEDGRYVKLWDRGTLAKSHNVVSNTPYSGIINTNAHTIHVESTKNSIPATVNAMHENASITRSLIEDMRTTQKQTRYSRPTKFGMGIIALSISIAMHALGPVVGAGIAKIGMESAIVSAMTTQAALGGMNALFQETANTFLNCNGDFRGAAKKLASTQTVRNIAIAALTGSATAGADKLLDKIIPPLAQAKTFNKRCLSAAPRELIKGGIRCTSDIAQGKNPKEAAKQRARSAVANTIGSVGSSQIGQAYCGKKIDPITHKALHTGLGALEGVITDGKEGIIAGALGAGLAETIADIASPKPPSLDDIKKVEVELGRPLTQDEFAREWNRQTVQYLKHAHSVGDASKMIAATVALLANQDLNIASEAAANAVDNNFFAQIIGVAITGVSTAYSAYLIHQTCQKEGIEAALKHLGIEVVLNAACVGAFKLGGKLYPSARAAIHAALDRNPALKTALGNVAESLVDGGKKLVQNLEQQAVRVSKHLNPSFAEDLVEHVVPNAVVNKVEKQLVEKAVKESAKQLALPAPGKVLLLPKPVASEAVKEASKETAKQLALPAPEKVLLLPKPVAGEVVKEVINIDHPVINNIRTGSGLKSDAHHAFPDIIDNFAPQAEKFIIKGGDQIVRELYQVEGSLNGQSGIFEWIVDQRPGYGVTHRMFIKNGKITGKPNVFARS